jgi:membrane protein implicated in regulation of membrane protease activity
MYRVKVVKATSSSALEGKINTVLEALEGDYVDIKVSGAYDGDDEVFVAVIVYRV